MKFTSLLLKIPISLVMLCISTSHAAINFEKALTKESLQTYTRTNTSIDPILTFGHGAFISVDGSEIKVTTEFILEAQKYYIDQLSKTVDSKELYLTQKRIYASVEDQAIANALYIDALLQQGKSSEDNDIDAKNTALRYFYIQYLQSSKLSLETRIRFKGLDKELAERLEKDGDAGFESTTASGEEYVKECEEAGVPIPTAMFKKPWENRGVFTDEFIAYEDEAELWVYESSAPDGICLALPRYRETNSKQTSVLGIICLGRETSKACFFDNPAGVSFTRDEPAEFSEFIGGDDLSNGRCSDCHSGENPFIVHPDKAPFAGLTPKLMPKNWYEPLIKPSWPQNPGPIDISAVDSQQGCDGCHSQSYAGRFPDVTQGLTGYCGFVLRNSLLGDIDDNRPVQTMPQGGNLWDYWGHADYLLSLCYGSTTTGDPGDDRDSISPPIIIDPLYACATQVAVKGTILDAKVVVYINGNPEGSAISRSPSQVDIDVPMLNVGDVVTATQEVDGVVSAVSDPVVVRDHKVDFPAGLPAPTIDPPLIYECGSSIAVRHVPGAKISVYVNGGDERSRNTSTGWSAITPGKSPFDLNDEFTARISLCSDDSPISSPEFAVAEPNTINAPSFDPSEIYAGQELITIRDILHGAVVAIEESGTGVVGKFSTPVSWKPEYDIASRLGRPLMAGDQLSAQQALCDKGPRQETPPARSCEDIPPPKIRLPFDGDESVYVTESVPGARIRIFDSSGNELGDGSGIEIALNRVLNEGEFISVFQQVGDCIGREGYRIQVQDIVRGKKDSDNK